MLADEKDAAKFYSTFKVHKSHEPMTAHRCKKGRNAGTMFPEIIGAGRNIQEDY